MDGCYRALLNSKNLFTRSFDLISDSVFILDTQNIIIYLNDVAARFISKPKEDAIGERIEVFLQSIEVTCEPTVVSEEYNFKNGRKRWYKINVYPDPEGTIVIVKEIDKRMRTTLSNEIPLSQQGISQSQILVVDDDSDQLFITKANLVESDPTLEITCVTSSREALEMLGEQHFDCIVSDYMMPKIDGIELARRTRKTSDTPFIIYTGRGSEEVAEVAFAAGVGDYVRKEQGPGHFKVLAKRIRTHIDHHHSILRASIYGDKIEALHHNAVNVSTAKSIEEVAEITYNTMRRVLGFELGGFSIVEDKTLKILKSALLPDAIRELPLDGRGLSVKAVRTEEVQLVHDVSKDEDYVSLGECGLMRSELDVPVKIDSRVVAVLTIINREVNAFSEEDVKLLETLAMHVSPAMSRIYTKQS